MFLSLLTICDVKFSSRRAEEAEAEVDDDSETAVDFDLEPNPLPEAKPARTQRNEMDNILLICIVYAVIFDRELLPAFLEPACESPYDDAHPCAAPPAPGAPVSPKKDNRPTTGHLAKAFASRRWNISEAQKYALAARTCRDCGGVMPTLKRLVGNGIDHFRDYLHRRGLDKGQRMSAAAGRKQ